MPIDYSEYHPKWSLISRLIRFKRAENKCEWCNAENYKPHPKTGSKVVLTVAHLDHNKANNKFDNLKALCQKCHLGHDLQHHIRNRKYGRNKAKRCFFLRIPSSINERSELMRLRLLPITNTGMKRPVLRLRQADLYLWLSAAFC
jgi:hypothetical protein